MRIVCISDTHNRHGVLRVPDGDVLVHAGDATMSGTLEELRPFASWFAALPQRHKLLIAGNHDWLFQRQPARARALFDEVTYLEDAGTEIDGVRFWGSPWQPAFLDWAFNLPRGPALAARWALVPPGTDVLVTHGPPGGIMDGVTRRRRNGSVDVEEAGCRDLLRVIERQRPRFHVFGHIHEGYGQKSRNGTTFVNASICNADYRPANAPIVLDL